MNDLKSKSILITGASTGIGAAAARAFGVAGARVAVHYRRNLAEAEAVVRDIESTGSQAFVVQADVTDTASVDRMVETIYGRFGCIDVLVNNAGGFVKRAPIVDADDEYIDAVFQLNARSVLAVSRRVIPLMQAGGSIINVTTQAARTGGGQAPDYTRPVRGSCRQSPEPWRRSWSTMGSVSTRLRLALLKRRSTMDIRVRLY